MPYPLPPMRGTLLNTATVAGGAAIGLILGERVPTPMQTTVLYALGLATLGMAVRMFLPTRNMLIVTFALALGAILGTLLGIQNGIESLAELAKRTFTGQGQFTEALVTTSILFCVGPMTILGCLKDGLERDIELLAVKSAMDGLVSIFFAAALGPGVLLTALVVLVVQGGITLLAGRLRALAEDEAMMADVSGAGGLMLLGLSFGLLKIKDIPVANFLPALGLVPIFVLFARRWEARRKRATSLV